MRAQCVVALLLGSLLAGASAVAVRDGDQDSVSPIQKVVQMMNDMLAKGKSEKEAETVEFAKYKMFCQMTRKEKMTSIAKGKEKIEQLTADIATAAADADTAAKEISVLDADVATWEGEKKESDKAREKAHSDYLGAHAEYEASIASVEKAKKTLEAGSGDVAQALIQLSATTHVPEHARRAIQSFVQRNVYEDVESTAFAQEEGAPKANAFEGHSGGIMEMVDSLGDKFKDEMKTLEKAETEENNNYQLLIQDVLDQIDDGKRESEEKKALKTQRESDKGEAEGDLADTETAVSEDEKFLKDVSQECARNSKDYEERQVARAGEITAIKKAIEIMTSDKVTGGKFVQTGAASEGTALAQLRSTSGSQAQAQAQSQAVKQGLVANFLADHAKRAGSRVLSLISTKVSAEPFKKVTKMIEDMINKLMEEANEEAEHKGFCDAEMGTNKVTRDQKTQEVAKLTAKIEELSAAIAKLGEEVSELGAAISAINTALAEATAIRSEEKTKNQATIKDAKIAGEATAQALAVLKEYYDKAAFLQEDSDGDAPRVNYRQQADAMIHGDSSLVQEPYKGMAGGGVMGMLETIESDFSRLVSETAAGEDEAERTYQKFKDDSEMDSAVKTTDMNHKTNSKTEKDTKLQSAKKDLATSQEELDAAMAYFEKLKPSCVDAGESYEDRVARRKEEIESLQEALKILSE